MKKIPVKIGWEIIVFILVLFSFEFYEFISNDNWNKLIMAIVCIAFVFTIIFTIQYKLDSKFLYVRNSIFGVTKIDINSIYKIKKTWNPLASPAPSIFGRIEIFYNKTRIIISPQNYEIFKNDLLKINPNIIINN